MSKTVSVFGATGAQGGSVARALLKDPSKWKVIALTRNVNSEKAKELKNLGAELRECDMTKAEDVENAVKGSDAVFGLTDFWGAKSKEEEITQGLNIVAACKKQGIQHLVLSTLENAIKISGGKRPVHHFDSKAEVEDELVKSGVPYTVVQAACYYENYKNFVHPNQEGQLEFALPIPGDSKFAMYSVAETGDVVSRIFAEREKYLGRKIALVGDFTSPSETAEVLSKQIGKPVKFNTVPEQVYASFPFPGADEIGNMFCFFHEYGLFGEKVNQRDIWEGKKISELSTFAQWAAKNWN